MYPCLSAESTLLLDSDRVQIKSRSNLNSLAGVAAIISEDSGYSL